MHEINVSVVYATLDRQWIYETRVARGTSAIELVTLSSIATQVEPLKQEPIGELNLGVFAQKVSHDYLLEEGDRVEIYRPLTADPKEVRRQLALLGKTISKTGRKDTPQAVD